MERLLAGTPEDHALSSWHLCWWSEQVVILHQAWLLELLPLQVLLYLVCRNKRVLLGQRTGLGLGVLWLGEKKGLAREANWP